MSKQSLRQWARGKRKEFDMEAVSAILADKLSQTNEYKNSKNIMLFYPLSNEVNLLSLLNDKKKNFYLPRINGKNLECCVYHMGDELSESKFHTKEPVCESCDKTNIDLIIVPALACDKNKCRLGYGGGFYDRFLEDYQGIKVVCIPHALLVPNIFPDNYDVKMDLIITELFSF